MFSLFRMVSYFWELGGDVLALHCCEHNGFGLPSARTSLTSLSPEEAPAPRYLNPQSLPSCGFGPQRFSPQPAPPTAARQRSELPAELELLPRSRFFLFTGSRAQPRHEPSSRLASPEGPEGPTTAPGFSSSTTGPRGCAFPHPCPGVLR